MSRKVFAALAILLFGWTAESQAGFMQPLFAGLSPFEARKLGFSAPSSQSQLCISPCFSVEGYIADSVFAARNDFVNFSPRSFPGLFPHGLIYADAGQTHQKKRKHKHKRKHDRKTNPMTNPVFLPLADPQLTETNDAPPPGGETRFFAQALEVNQVPVPATLALFGLGLAALGWSRRKPA